MYTEKRIKILTKEEKDRRHKERMRKYRQTPEYKQKIKDKYKNKRIDIYYSDLLANDEEEANEFLESANNCESVKDVKKLAKKYNLI